MAKTAGRKKKKAGPSRKTTASAEEIARFTAMAEAWWDPMGDFRPLHQINPVRLEFIRDNVARHFGLEPLGRAPFEGLNIIDIGCGGGLLTEPMRRLGATVTGIDAGEEAIRIARTHAERTGLDIEYRHQLPEDIGDEKGIPLVAQKRLASPGRSRGSRTSDAPYASRHSAYDHRLM